ncbi:MAG: nucleotidyltransferase domain-containing protein [Candidatus Freyarchaeota archaeon]
MPLEIEERERFRFFELRKRRKEALLRKIVNLLENREEVFWAFVYGSFLRDVPFRDVDIAVYVDRDVDPLDFRFRLDRELSRAIGLPVDVKVINRAPPWFIIKVINEGRRLVEKIPLLTEKLYLKAIDEKAKIASA